MSRETLQWLNTNTLIGFTDKRGHAWHWRAQEQNGTSNHYPGAIPITDVQDRLFHWTAESRRFAVELDADLETVTHLSDDGSPKRWAVVPDKQAICRSDDGTVMGIFGPGYTRHQYREWLLTTVADLLDDDLAISSAGLLRGGAIAWVEVSMPDTITTPQGVAFRPNLLATTSFDGSIATTYKRTVTDTVCDNTRELALSEAGQEFKVKHSRQLPRPARPGPAGAGDGAHPGRRLRRRGRAALQHHRHRRTVDGVPRPARPPRRRADQPTARRTGPHAGRPQARGAAAAVPATTPASHPGRAPPKVSCRP